jgi:hypothetical protein
MANDTDIAIFPNGAKTTDGVEEVRVLKAVLAAVDGVFQQNRSFLRLS